MTTLSFVPPPGVLNLSAWVPSTSSEGPGRRFALWVQGCAIRCPACCNPEMFAFQPRHLLPVPDVLALIQEARCDHSIEGITILGGEPFSQASALADLAEAVRTMGLSIFLFSGHTLEELRERGDEATDRLLAAADLLVDGPYLREVHTEERRWIGSTNQRLHFLTDRYSPDDPCWTQKNSVELFFDGAEIKFSGWPKPAWKRQILALKEHLEAKKAHAPPTPTDDIR